MTSWIENSQALTLINTMDEAQTEQCRGKLIRYINQYQEDYPFDILDDVQAYMQLKLDTDDLDFNTIPDEIKQAITEGYYEYCISLNEISAAYMIVTKSTPLTRLDLIQFVNHLLEAYSCNYPEDEFLVPRLAEFADLLTH
ncbi:hypothetical protein [Providencia rettgeri]|jgi:hypothetical protein|uniref:hypothetical protein n=1 Tax=Providencia rettgeri TaxID=587 RepID=UPI002362D1B6|nr:hypothetical protein [Providencia rettgeri]MDR2224666.1 hypothetical protein [Providencia sp.]